MVFGYSGGGTGALIHQVAISGLTNMNARTELAGTWMSYGYNRVKGRAASACIFHCVGMLHATPAVYAAKVDSTPLFVMDVNLDSALDLREGLQDSHDIYSALKPLSKYSRKVVLADDLPLAVRQSVLAASTGRPGPSVLDLGFQVLINNTSCAVETLTLPKPPAADEDTIEEILSMIRKAANPILLAGAGVHLAGASAELQEFAELLGNLIAQLVYLLLTHPKQWEELKSNRNLIQYAVEETMRLRGPVRGLVRKTTADVELSGVQIPRG
jgi:acetolactate synthase I/II/III large subunit